VVEKFYLLILISTNLIFKSAFSALLYVPVHAEILLPLDSMIR